MPDAMRQCKECQQTKPISEFYSKGGGKRDWTCKTCRQRQAESRRSNSIESFMADRYARLKSNRIKQFDWEIVVADLLHLWREQKGRCALSGRLMTAFYDGTRREDQVSVDRIRPDIGYLPNNIQLVCYRANMLKHTLSQPNFIHWCRQIVEYQDAHKD